MFVQSRTYFILIDKIVSTEDKLLLKDYKTHKEWPSRREPVDPADLRITIPRPSSGKSGMNYKIKTPSNLS